ncbi:MAG: TonB-dependent receptor [Bacteroidetes bacterium]|nr:TonB-dependent receptor [Bacteroidota bacterium]
MMRFAVILWLMFLSGDIAAQSLKGRVISDDGAPIPGANVLVEGTTFGASANVDGRFEITKLPVGTVVVRISSVGFYSDRVTLVFAADEHKEVEWTLKEKVFESDEVVVTASRREQPALSVPVSVSIVSAEELSRRNVISLDDALRSVSGVQVLDNQINIRGSSGFAYNTGSRVLMMLDGRPLLTADSDGIPLEALPSSQIERIEVLKGPGSALYGSGALGGVINVITKDFPDTPTTTVRTFAGTWEPVRYQTWRQGWKHGEEFRPFWGLSASYAQKQSPKFGWWGNFTFRRDSGYMELSGRDVFHGFGKATWRPKPAYKLDVLLGLMAKQQDAFIFWSSARDVLSPGRVSFGDPPKPNSSPNGAPDNFVKQISFLPSFTHFLNAQWFYEIKARVFGSLVQPIDDQTGELKNLSEGTVGFRYGAEGQLNWFPQPATRLVFGVSRDAITTESSFFTTSDGDALGGQPEVALFSHLEQELTEDLQLVGGLRYDHYQVDNATTETRLSPKLSLAYTWVPGQVVRVAWGHGFRVPSFAERFTDDREFLPIVRNLDLRPERSQSIELGIRGAIPLGGLLSWDFSAFHNTYSGFIEPRLVLAEQAFQFINLPNATIDGAEIQLEWQDESERLKINAGYTFLDSKEDATGEDLPFRARHQFVTSLDSKIWRTITGGLDFRFASQPDRVESDFARFIPDAEITGDTRVLDLRLSGSKGPFEVAVIVNNALEYYYVERPALLGAPRRYTLRLTYRK